MSLGLFPQTSLGPSEILRSKGMYNSIHPDSRQCMDTMFSARGCVSDIHPRAIFPDALPGEQGVYWIIRSLEIISFDISLVSSEPMINASLIMMRECMARQDMASCRGYMASSSKLLGGSACRESPAQHIAMHCTITTHLHWPLVPTHLHWPMPSSCVKSATVASLSLYKGRGTTLASVTLSPGHFLQFRLTDNKG